MHGQGIRISRRVAHSRTPVSRLSGEVNRIERSTVKLDHGGGKKEEGRMREEGTEERTEEEIRRKERKGIDRKEREGREMKGGEKK